MRSSTRLVGGIGLVVGLTVSGCALSKPAANQPETLTTSTVSPTRDPAANPYYKNVGSGPYRLAANLTVAEDPVGVAVDSARQRVYVASGSGRSVAVIDSRTRAVVDTIEVDGYPTSLQSIAVDPVTHLVFVIIAGGSGNMLVIDPERGEVIDSVPSGGDPDAIAVDGDRRRIYVTNDYYKTVTAIDADTREIVATIPIGGSAVALAIDPATHRVFVPYENNVTVIDPETHVVISNIPIEGSGYGIAIDPATRSAYVTSFHGGPVTIIGTGSLAVTGTVAVQSEASMAAAIDAGTGTVFLTSGAFDSVTMIDTETREITASRRMEHDDTGTWGIAVDPATHDVYVTKGEYSRVVQILALD